MTMFERIYEKVTGRPYLTVRSMAAEFGPTPATRYPELLDHSDAELVERGDELLAEAHARWLARCEQLADVPDAEVWYRDRWSRDQVRAIRARRAARGLHQAGAR